MSDPTYQVFFELNGVVTPTFQTQQLDSAIEALKTSADYQCAEGVIVQYIEGKPMRIIKIKKWDWRDRFN